MGDILSNKLFDLTAFIHSKGIVLFVIILVPCIEGV